MSEHTYGDFSVYCIIVKNVLKPGTKDDYLAAMLPNATASVRDEPGCHRFDVLEVREEPNTFYLYEIYDDPDALTAHKETAHYKESRIVLAACVDEVSVIRADVLHRVPEQ